MKIKRKLGPDKIAFTKLAPGDAFLYDHGLYMKTHKGADGANAVKLQTGALGFFGQGVGVDIINVEIVEV